MNEKLLASAQSLVQPSATAASEFNEKQASIVSTVVQRLKSRPDIREIVGEHNLPLMEDNAHNFASFMYSQFRKFEPEALVQTVLWAIGVYRARGFDRAFWPAHLRAFMHAIEEHLSAASLHETLPFYEWIQVNLPLAFESVEASGDQG